MDILELYWVINMLSQAELRLEVYGILNLVKGIETRPEPADDGPVTQAIRKGHHRWDRHALACEALLNYLNTSELISIYYLKSAPSMWAKLHDEYGQTSLILHTEGLQAPLLTTILSNS
jgi:hypothetical protein